MISPFKRLRLALLALLALVALGTIGYIAIEGYTPLEALYMTVITLATVGYREVRQLTPAGMIFTIVLIVFGVSIGFWAVASLIETVVSEEIRHTYRRKKMQNEINKLRNHFIICGYGRMGQEIIRVFRKTKTPHVVIEVNPEQIPKLVEQNVPFIEGDASDDKILIAAGIKVARGLVTVAASDQENVFITLTARGLNPSLFIVARSILEDNEGKLRRAGASRVMSPYITGGKRMAYGALRPTVIEFLDATIHADGVEFELEEVTVTPKSTFINKLIRDSKIREQAGATILAVKSTDGSMVYNPKAETLLREDDVLILVGTPSELVSVRKMAAGE